MVPVFLTVLLEPEFLRAHYHSCSTVRPRAHLPYRREAAVPGETAAPRSLETISRSEMHSLAP